jgi:hypothetical protein
VISFRGERGGEEGGVLKRSGAWRVRLSQAEESISESSGQEAPLSIAASATSRSACSTAGGTRAEDGSATASKSAEPSGSASAVASSSACTAASSRVPANFRSSECTGLWQSGLDVSAAPLLLPLTPSSALCVMANG